MVISHEGGGSISSRNKSGRICSAAASASPKWRAIRTSWDGANFRNADVIATCSAPYSSTNRMPPVEWAEDSAGSFELTNGKGERAENRKTIGLVKTTRRQ